MTFWSSANRLHRALRGTTSGPLFCWPGGAPVKRSIFVEQLNRALTFYNLDPTLYKAHSFRIGAATWAAAKGLSDPQIRQLGRWKSNAFLNYIRTPSLSTNAARSWVICPQTGAEELFTFRPFSGSSVFGRSEPPYRRLVALFSPPLPLPERKKSNNHS